MTERKNDPLFWEKLRTGLLAVIVVVLLVFSVSFASRALLTSGSSVTSVS